MCVYICCCCVRQRALLCTDAVILIQQNFHKTHTGLTSAFWTLFSKKKLLVLCSNWHVSQGLNPRRRDNYCTMRVRILDASLKPIFKKRPLPAVSGPSPGALPLSRRAHVWLLNQRHIQCTLHWIFNTDCSTLNAWIWMLCTECFTLNALHWMLYTKCFTLNALH